MEKSLLLRKSLFSLVFLFLGFPLVILAFNVPLGAATWDPFLGTVVAGALKQSIFSLLLTLFLSFIGTFGLISLKAKVSKINFQIFCFLISIPAFLPPIIVVVLGVKSLGQLYTGLSGVVLYHLIMNIGLITYLLFNQLNDKAQLWMRDSYIMAVSPLKFILKGLLPEIKEDLFAISFYLFVLYFFSFSVPFLVGGSQYGGIEVFIYEKIVFLGQWSEALHYTFVLFLLLLILSSWVRSPSGYSLNKIESIENYSSYLGFTILSVIPLLPFLLILLGFVEVLLGQFMVFNWNENWQEIRVSLFTGLSVALCSFVILSLLVFCFMNHRWTRILISWVQPGWVIVGFSFLLISGNDSFWRLILMILALSILYLPYLLRLNFFGSLNDLKDQVKVSRNFPVSWWTVFKQVLWPQTLPTICLLSGLAGVWACGDFAMGDILIDPSQGGSLALKMKHLLSNYRLEKAIELSLPLIVCCAIIMAVFQGFSYVSRKKTI